jgi:plasmid maintenance system antidote protein VapI
MRSAGVKMMRMPKNRQAIHPGEVLRDEFLIPMGLTQKELVDAIRVPSAY